MGLEKNSTPGASTPTTSYRAPLRITDFPIMPASEPNWLSQSECPSTATAFAPGLSSAAVNVRPSVGLAPIKEKKGAETLAPGKIVGFSTPDKSKGAVS